MLTLGQTTGNLTAIENKIKELATGTWGRRRALTKPASMNALPVPLAKAVYGGNGRIMWSVHVTYDEGIKSAKQVILGTY